jgi:hypothetical protein
MQAADRADRVERAVGEGWHEDIALDGLSSKAALTQAVIDRGDGMPQPFKRP